MLRPSQGHQRGVGSAGSAGGVSASNNAEAAAEKPVGAWVPFHNHMGAELLLPGPNGGGAVGLPNFVPLGHPALAGSSSSVLYGARAAHGSAELEQLLVASNVGPLAGMSGPIGIEGRPYVSLAERNRAEARNVSEATMLLASLARDAAQHGTPRTVAKHNTTLAQLRVGNSNSLVKGGFNAAAPVSTAGPLSSAALGNAASRGGMPTFAVESFMRHSVSLTSEQDRLSAAEVLRIEPMERTEAHIATLAKFLASVAFFAPLSEPLRKSIAGLATLRTLRKDEIVFKEGDPSVHLFVVLSGSVGTRVRDWSTSSSSAGSFSSSSAAAAADRAGFVAVTASVGELFGAETLGGSDERTVIARSQTKLALEPRTEVLRVALSKEAQDKMAFVASLPMFERCTMRELHRVASVLQPLSVPKSTLVFKQGDMPSEQMFFIVKGQVRVVHKTYTKTIVTEKEVRTTHHSRDLSSHSAAPSRRTARSGGRRSRHPSSASGLRLASSDEDDKGYEDGEEAAAEAKEQADGFGSGAFATAGAATRAASSADVIARAATVGHGRSVSMASKQGRDRERSNSPSADSPAHRHIAHSRHSSTRSGGGGGGGAFQFEREQAFNAHRRSRTAADGSQREWASSTGGIGSSVVGPFGHSRSASHVPVTRTVLEPHLLDLGRLGPGWFFGELGVLRSEARSASVYAESSCELLVLSRSDVFGRLPAECLRFLEEYAAHFYAPTAELKQQFKQQRRWEQFKQRMRQQSRRAPSLAESVAGFSGSLQDLKH
jgi:CRP-like cAMP-binding protein